MLHTNIHLSIYDDHKIEPHAIIPLLQHPSMLHYKSMKMLIMKKMETNTINTNKINVCCDHIFLLIKQQQLQDKENNHSMKKEKNLQENNCNNPVDTRFACDRFQHP